MSKRIKILGISVILVISAIAIYFTLTYQSKEAWLKDYLYEAYGGKQFIRVGEDGKYYAQFAGLSEVKFENEIFKAEKTYHEYCLQPERNYYDKNDIYITPDKAVYQYDENEISFTITNNSGFPIGDTSSENSTVDFIGKDIYDIDVNVDGQWYAVFLGMYPENMIKGSELHVIEANRLYAKSIPTDIFGANRFGVDESGNIHFVHDYFKLRPGVYRICLKFRYPTDADRPWVKEIAYLACTFEIK